MGEQNTNGQMQIGDVLGDRYRIISLLGRGGMSTVYLAHDLKLEGKKWAVKQQMRSEQDAGLFMEEAEMLVQLNHSNLPTIVDYFPPNESNYSFLVMDYIHGTTLLEWFERNRGRIPVDHVLKYAVQLCDLFEYLHHFESGPIIYRDLKPSNVMIDSHDQVRLIDFGIARSYKDKQNSDTVRIGTIGFAAPEQFEQKQTDHRTDLYALGAMMYFLLSGGKYFYLEQKTLREVAPDVSKNLSDIVHKTLMPRPEDRYQDASELKRVLTSIKQYNSSHAGTGNGFISDPKLKKRSVKLVIVGSLYPGAGSTFITMAAARILNRLNISHAVVEYPGNDPELFWLLFGDKHAPKHYRSLFDKPSMNSLEWTDGHTAWYPANPNRSITEWNTEQIGKALHSIEKPIVLLDISGLWHLPAVREVCEKADDIVCVTGPLPSRMNRPRALEIYNRLVQYKKNGRSVHLVANRDPAVHASADWTDAFPIPPVSIVPDIGFAEVVQSSWEGSLVMDKPDILMKLGTALHPLLSRIVQPYHYPASGRPKKTRWLSWLRS